MRFLTRCALLLIGLALPLAPTLAANITILVGDNYYRGPGNTTLDFDVRDITVGDIVTFSYVGRSSHPTISDSSPAAWPLFQMNASSTSVTLPAFNTVGAFPYHCTAHGGVGVGQYGILNVKPRTPTASLNARDAGISLSIYPNPSRGQITAQLNQKPSSGDYKLRLSNIIGQEIRTVALKPELTTAGLPIDLSDLRTGVYFYSLVVDGRVTSTRRLVLQN